MSQGADARRVDNLVLLCDVDHGLVHDQDLTIARPGGRLAVTTPDGRHVWGTADAAFTTGLDGVEERPVSRGGVGDTTDATTEPAASGSADRDTDRPTTADSWTGVHPIDSTVGRRPTPRARNAAAATERAGAHHPRRVACRRPGRRPGARPTGHPAPPGAVGRLPRPAEHTVGRGRADVQGTNATISHTLFPAGEPDLPDAMPVNGERMDLRYAVGVLMGHRDFVRRLAAEAGAAGAAVGSGP
ncbi:hypothetical protein [Geodermatophilus sp. DSM 44513]|uniref:hypothetical protein n=1 Tax=Geodermatophilus sp. DSM 44513 TaxID=1528104 RepID=UPI0028F72293|nr:hypothetical protein [Geodermatophilus sp. DSM 44513]WNV75921.1 hypothetical protein RTG05_01275 [Geodermatophilus sp. DSM 44513]